MKLALMRLFGHATVYKAARTCRFSRIAKITGISVKRARKHGKLEARALTRQKNLFVAKRLDGIEARSFVGGIETKEDCDPGGEARAQQ